MKVRHITNQNLTLSSQDTYNDYPIQTHCGALAINYLERIDKTLVYALLEHARTFVIRVDLRLPANKINDKTNVISKFFDSLKAQIRADLLKKEKGGIRVHPCTLRYIWVKEKDTSINNHYHVLLLLNHDTYHTLGDFKAEEGNMAARIKKAWTSALNIDFGECVRLVYFPRNPTYSINANSKDAPQDINSVIHRTSYFAKVKTKSYGDGKRSFGCSMN